MKLFSFIDHTPDTIGQGHVPQRPGPKPKTEPAPSRRQEMNRQAQRLHRSRQTAYIKQLEAEVQQIRKGYLAVCEERDQYKQMYEDLNKRLTSEHMDSFMFDHHSMATPPQKDETSSLIVSPISLYSEISGYADSHSTSTSTSPDKDVREKDIETHAEFDNIHINLDSRDKDSLNLDLCLQTPSHSSHTESESDSDSEAEANVQLGVDFVLAMERECMDHLHPLNPDGTNPFRPKDVIDGHAMMISWNRHSHKFLEVPPEIALAASNCSRTRQRVIGNDLCVKQKEELKSLASLLKLSSKLSLSDSEMTPVSAWFFMSKHPNFKHLDHQKLKHYLADHTRCLGFGAVISKSIVEGVLQTGI